MQIQHVAVYRTKHWPDHNSLSDVLSPFEQQSRIRIKVKQYALLSLGRELKHRLHLCVLTSIKTILDKKIITIVKSKKEKQALSILNGEQNQLVLRFFVVVKNGAATC
jgi:hypothetical protein